MFVLFLSLYRTPQAMYSMGASRSFLGQLVKVSSKARSETAQIQASVTGDLILQSGADVH